MCLSYAPSGPFSVRSPQAFQLSLGAAMEHPTSRMMREQMLARLMAVANAGRLQVGDGAGSVAEYCVCVRAEACARTRWHACSSRWGGPRAIARLPHNPLLRPLHK